MGRKERRANDPTIQVKREQYAGSPLAGNPIAIVGVGPAGGGNSGGWGVGNAKSVPASGQSPSVNPFMQPKAAGLNIISQTFPSNYYVDWDVSTWRYVCDQVLKSGYTMSYATLIAWTFESSPFVQSLFEALGNPIGKVPFLFTDAKGNELPEWTLELCSKSWQKDLRKQIGLSKFPGFVGLNFDPINGKVYKYPMQDIDPINRMLKQSTYSFYDGINFSDNDNLLFIQPDTSYEGFLGWMQPIARSFIQMNLTDNNWLGAGKRLAFPLMTVGYPQNTTDTDPTGMAYNPMKTQAEDIARNVDPSQGVVYPYTLDAKGNIVKSIEVAFEKSGTNAKAHAIFTDFNDAKKNEIREMILGGTLTSSVGASGSRALGTVHEDKLESVILNFVEFIEAYLNDEYIKKISKFYKNFPVGGKFVANKAKQLSIEDIKTLSDVLTANGKRLTDEFFLANGLVREFFEDAPQIKPANIPESDDGDFAAAISSRSLFGSKKKF